MSAQPIPFDSLRRFSANPEQFADARLAYLAEGNGRGNRVVSVRNGSGLDFTVTPDRGMDIVDCSFRGIPMVFRTPVGYADGGRFEPMGIAWLRNWAGGLLTTAGLRSVGTPNGEFGLHGRISNQSAEDVGITRGEADGEYRLQVAGTVRESMMFGEDLRLRRVISTAYGRNEIEVADEVTNLACKPDYLQIVYHCNFGYPLVSPEMEFLCPEHRVIPRTEKAAKNLSSWHLLPEPAAEYEEECFFHDLPAAPDGFASMTVRNRSIGVKMTISYDTANLPRLLEWKNALTGSYVLGLEPTNAMLCGRTQEIADGTARRIEPGETVVFRVKFAFEAI